MDNNEPATIPCPAMRCDYSDPARGLKLCPFNAEAGHQRCGLHKNKRPSARAMRAVVPGQVRVHHPELDRVRRRAADAAAIAADEAQPLQRRLMASRTAGEWRRMETELLEALGLPDEPR